MSPGLFQAFTDGYIKPSRFSPLVVEHIVVVITAGSQSRLSQIGSYGKPIFDCGFVKFVFRISRGIQL